MECACCRSFDNPNEAAAVAALAMGRQENIPCDGFPMIEVDDAIAMILTQVDKLDPVLIPINKCSGHIIAEDIIAQQPFPAFPTSMMDGYAVNGYLTAGIYQLQDRILAGDEGSRLNPGQEISPFWSSSALGMVSYITTGAQIPEGANSVVKVACPAPRLLTSSGRGHRT
jgi:molybdopterin biosynthesis enzyme